MKEIEHQALFVHNPNWCGKPFVSHEVISNLIAVTTTESKFRVHAEIDASEYPLGKMVMNTELAEINIQRHEFHSAWGYTILPLGNSTVIS